MAAVPELTRHDLILPDGRRVYLYGDFQAAPDRESASAATSSTYERRWNPLRGEWVLVAAVRQGRTFLPSAPDCPLCPSRPDRFSEIPATQFRQAVFENRFPAMQSAGICEVVVYSDHHEESLSTLGPAVVRDLVEVWIDRYRELASRSDVDYVFIFENRGEAVGVTLNHPHGQIYGYPFIPPVARTELRAGRDYLRRTNACLQCSLIEGELNAEERVLFVDDGMAAYVPSYARWPYEVHVAPVAHAWALPDLSPIARARFGEALQKVARAYDRLFDQPMPYMMVIHQRPTDGRPHPEAHLHVEFYPVMRAPGRLKFLAGGECGAGTFVSDGLPEEKAAELKRVL